MDEVLLDTDILNEVLKQKNGTVVRHATNYLSQHQQFSLSVISRYERLRGLKEKHASAQILRFHEFCQNSLLLPIVNDILDEAADLWAFGRRRGITPMDADLIIAATAIFHRQKLVTGNTIHFDWIPNLAIANWRYP